VRESRLISINEDEGKSTGAGVSAVYQVNRAQTKHSARNRMLAKSIPFRERNSFLQEVEKRQFVWNRRQA